MKKITTLLLLVVGMAFAASATTPAEQCIDVLLGKTNANMIQATNLDINHDGVLDITDVTMLIDKQLQEQGGANRTPAKEQIDVKAIVEDILDNEPPTPNINDVNEAIHKNLEK